MRRKGSGALRSAAEDSAGRGGGRFFGNEAMLQSETNESTGRPIRAASKGMAKGGTALINFGAYGLKAMAPGRASRRARSRRRGRAITRHMKRVGKLWIRVFPDVPVSQKPAEVRRARARARRSGGCRVKPGRIMFELDGVPSRISPGGLHAWPRPSCRSRPSSSRRLGEGS